MAGTRLEFALPAAALAGQTCGLHVTANGLVFMIDTANQEQLWRTDGTLAGTFRLGDIRPPEIQNGNPTRGSMVSSGGVAYLLAEAGVAYEPWRTDGTQAGTVPVGGLPVGTGSGLVFRPVVLGDGIVFAYQSDTGIGNGLWRVASPTSGATLVKAGSVIKDFLPVSAGSSVYFGITEGNVTGLWNTDGTAAGTRELFNYGAGVPPLVNAYFAGDGVLFYHGPIDGSGQQLWVTNGIPGAQRKISDFVSRVGTQRRDYALLNGLPVFTHFDQALGFEPWIVRGVAPVATADTGALAANGNLLINVKANDTDGDSPVADLALSISAPPANGSAVVEAGAVRYTPVAGFSGSDSFQYRLTDELGKQSGAATVTVTVSAPPASGGGGGGSGGSGGGGSGGGGGGALGWGLVVLLAGMGYRRARETMTHR